MPTNSVGYSFAPTFDQAEQGRRGGSPPNTSQAPLEVLNFRLKPRVAGAAMGGFSPQTGQDQVGSSIGQAVLMSVLRTVLGAGADPFMGAHGFSGAAPVSVTPGVGDGQPRSPEPLPGGYDGSGITNTGRPHGPIEPLPPPTIPNDFPRHGGPEPLPGPDIPQDFPPYGGGGPSPEPTSGFSAPQFGRKKFGNGGLSSEVLL